MCKKRNVFFSSLFILRTIEWDMKCTRWKYHRKIAGSGLLVYFSHKSKMLRMFSLCGKVVLFITMLVIGLKHLNQNTANKCENKAQTLPKMRYAHIFTAITSEIQCKHCNSFRFLQHIHIIRNININCLHLFITKMLKPKVMCRVERLMKICCQRQAYR